MFVWERGGKVWIVQDGVKSASPFLDLSEEVGGWRDFGLLGFCFHPGFQTNGYVYLLYVVDHHHLKYFGMPNYDPNADEYFVATIGRITRYTARASDGFRSVDPASRKILLGESITNGFPILHQSHGVGTILFGADGSLLVSCGDGASYSSTDIGSATETYYAQALTEGIIRTNENVGAYRSQMVNSLNGKILRLDPETGDGILGNPFYDPAYPRRPGPGCGRWACGTRAAWRCAPAPAAATWPMRIPGCSTSATSVGGLGKTCTCARGPARTLAGQASRGSTCSRPTTTATSRTRTPPIRSIPRLAVSRFSTSVT